MPKGAFIDLSFVAVGVGSLLLLRLVGGAMPWGRLLIAVGPDGRPLRPRVKWHLWSISRGEPPRLAAVAGLLSVALGLASFAAVGPPLVRSIFRPVSSELTWLLVFTLATACVVIPMGLTVLVRASLDLIAPRSSMMGSVVGLRRDLSLFGHTYHIAIQSGHRALAQRLWAESFRVDRRTFEGLSPGDRVTMEYSPHLRYVYSTERRETGRLARSAPAS